MTNKSASANRNKEAPYVKEELRDTGCRSCDRAAVIPERTRSARGDSVGNRSVRQPSSTPHPDLR